MQAGQEADEVVMSTMPETKTITLPADQVARLEADAKTMGLGLPAYLAFLEQCRSGRLDAKARDAARFVFSTQDQSLRKLAE